MGQTLVDRIVAAPPPLPPPPPPPPAARDILRKARAGAGVAVMDRVAVTALAQAWGPTSQQRASIAARLPALHSILIRSPVQRKALVREGALRRLTYGAAAHGDLAYLLSGQDTSLSLAEQRQLLAYAMTRMAARTCFQSTPVAQKGTHHL